MKELLFSLIAASALAGLALWKKALTPAGLLLAWALAVVIAFCGGVTGFLALAATFVFTILAGKLSGRVGKEIGAKLHSKAGRRDAVQIVCNVLVGALMLLLRALTRRDAFLWAYGGAMAASLADSMASELGVLSKRPPRDVLTLRPVQAGLSGGVTLLGLGCSLLGAAIIAAICAAGFSGSWPLFAAVSVSGFVAALCDSVLGSALQAKYRCPVCGMLTEKSLHCGAPGKVERGCRFVSNDGVNLANNVLGALCALGLYLILR